MQRDHQSSSTTVERCDLCCANAILLELKCACDRWYGPIAYRGEQSKLGWTRSDRVFREFLDWFQPLADVTYAGVLLLRGQNDQADDLIKQVDRGHDHYRMRYDVACFYSVQGEVHKSANRPDDVVKKAFSSALVALEPALDHGGSLVDWATKDPSLEGVRVAEPDAFRKVIERHTFKIADTSIAGISGIGRTYATMLKDHGIVTPNDLLLGTASRDQRTDLAAALAINVEHLLRWGQLAEMSRVPGITIPTINLMNAAGVRTLRALSLSNDERLHQRLREVNQGFQFLEEVPTLESVRKWIEEASKLKLLVA
jgi:hypothetical protein